MDIQNRISKQESQKCLKFLRAQVAKSGSNDKVMTAASIGSFNRKELHAEVKKNSTAGKEILKVVVNYLREHSKKKKQKDHP